MDIYIYIYVYIYIYLEVEFCLQLYVVAKSHEPQSTGAQGGVEGFKKKQRKLLEALVLKWQVKMGFELAVCVGII